MEVEYASHKIKEQCEKWSAAKKLFGGNEALAKALLARIQQLKAAVTLEGYFAIDVKTRKDAWRLIIQPLDENRAPFVPCNVDEISGLVRIVRVERVSKHYD